MPTANHSNGVKVLMLTEQKMSTSETWQGEVAHTVYIFPNDQKNIADENASDPGTPSTPGEYKIMASSTGGFWVRDIGDNVIRIIDYAFDYTNETPTAQGGVTSELLLAYNGTPNQVSGITLENGSPIAVQVIVNGAAPIWVTVDVGSAAAAEFTTNYAAAKTLADAAVDGTGAAVIAADTIAITETGLAALVAADGNLKVTSIVLASAPTVELMTAPATIATSATAVDANCGGAGSSDLTEEAHTVTLVATAPYTSEGKTYNYVATGTISVTPGA